MSAIYNYKSLAKTHTHLTTKKQFFFYRKLVITELYLHKLTNQSLKLAIKELYLHGLTYR